MNAKGLGPRLARICSSRIFCSASEVNFFLNSASGSSRYLERELIVE